VEKTDLSRDRWLVSLSPFSLDEFCAKATNSIAKGMNLIAKVTN